MKKLIFCLVTISTILFIIMNANAAEKINVVAPDITFFEQNGSELTITWTGDTTVTGYQLQYSINPDFSSKITVKVNDNTVTSKTIAELNPEDTYFVRVRAYLTTDGKNYYSKWTVTSNISLITPDNTNITAFVREDSKLNIAWTEITTATGYQIQYSTLPTFAKYDTIDIADGSKNQTVIEKLDAKKVYFVRIRVYNIVNTVRYYSDWVISSNIALITPEKISIKSFKRKKKSLSIKWTKNENATDYVIQYSKSPVFNGVKKVNIKPDTQSVKISNLNKDKTYYARVRVCTKINDKNYYSAWTYSSNVKTTKTLPVKYVTKKNNEIELRNIAKQAMYAYDTVQGGCTDGTYAYFVMYNRKVENCKIVKLKVSSMKVVKVSDVLEIHHGNDITYNKDKNILVVAHCKVNINRFSIINPKSLEIIEDIDVIVPTDLSGGKSTVLKFNGIQYDSAKKQYIALTNAGEWAVLDKDMVPIGFVKPTVKIADAVYQGLDLINDYVLVVENPQTIVVYERDGIFVTKLILQNKYELENVFHIKKKFYASFYVYCLKIFYKVSYKTGYKTKYVWKNKKVDGKTKKVKVAKKVKTKIKVKTPYLDYSRDNYICTF